MGIDNSDAVYQITSKKAVDHFFDVELKKRNDLLVTIDKFAKKHKFKNVFPTVDKSGGWRVVGFEAKEKSTVNSKLWVRRSNVDFTHGYNQWRPRKCKSNDKLIELYNSFEWYPKELEKFTGYRAQESMKDGGYFMRFFSPFWIPGSRIVGFMTVKHELSNGKYEPPKGIRKRKLSWYAKHFMDDE